MEWRLMKDEEPTGHRIFWGFIKGRMECDGYRDAEIHLLVNDAGMGDLRSLDYACRYVVEGHTTVVAEWDNVIAWMPIEEMILPNGYKLQETA